MSLMQEWVRLFPDAKPRSNANAVAGASLSFPNFTAIKSPYRDVDDWAYDDYDEVSKYSSKGMESDLAWMGGKFNAAQTHGTYADGILQDLEHIGPAVQGSKESLKANAKQAKITESTRRTYNTGKQTRQFRALPVSQIENGWAASIAGLKEYNEFSDLYGGSMTLEAFKLH